MDLFAKYAHEFTEEDRERCIKTAQKVLWLAESARREGLLALESILDDDDSFFFKVAVHLIVDGTDPKVVEAILSNFILSGNYNSFEKLNACIIMNGMLSMQAGENPRIIHFRLASMLGEKHCFEFFTKPEFHTDRQEQYQLALSKLEADQRETLKECEQFEALILNLNDKSLQRILRDISSIDLVIALSGLSFCGIKKVMDNISSHMSEFILNDINRCSLNKQSILSAQGRILKRIDLLEKSAEIILSRGKGGEFVHMVLE